MIPTLFGVAVLIFLLLRVLPGDIVELKYAGTGSYAPKEALARERAQLGLDQPIWKQFITWIVGIPRLDFGTSMWTGQPITHEIAIRLELSIELALMATFVAVLISIPLGALAAVKQDTWIDYFVRIFSIAGLAIPSFWLGIIIILTFVIYFRWLPPANLYFVLGRSEGESFTVNLAGPGGRLPLFGSGDAYDALGDVRGIARRLHPHRAGERVMGTGCCHSPCAQKRAAAGHYRNRT